MNNSKKPAVTIVIPTYNHAHFLKRALGAVRSQSFTDWEVIIVNNFSTDNTEEIINGFNDPRFKLINFSNQGVIAAARNEGIKQAKGEFIAFLDSDDFWLPAKLEKCLYELKESQADLVCHGEVQMHNGKKQKSLVYGPEEKSNYLSMLFDGNCVSTSAVVVKHSSLLKVGLFNEDKTFNTAEDYDLWLRLSKGGFKFKFIKEELGEYLIHDGNNSGSIARHLQAVIRVTEIHFVSIEKKFLKKRFRIGTLYYGAARQAQSQFKIKISLQYFIHSLLLNPLRIKTYLGLFLGFTKIIDFRNE